MYYYLYCTTNTINGKTYYGVHKTNNLEDGYLGSGILLQRAITKYGRDSFKKNILEFFNNEKDMFAKEREIVTEKLIENKSNYNIKLGGLGGFDHIHRDMDVCIEKSRKTRSEWSDEYRLSVNKKKAVCGEANGMANSARFGNKNPMWGKKQKKSTRKKISEIHKGKIVVKDALTDVIIGQVSKNHENVLSGKWVHINLGRVATPEARKALSEDRIRRGVKPPSPKGMLWWNNGVENFRSREQPEGCVRGRLPW